MLFFVIVRHVKKIVSLWLSLAAERSPMKNILWFLLIAMAHTSLSMDESAVVDVTTLNPATLMATAVGAAKEKDIGRATACAALSKIFTRIDAACIPGHFDHDQADSVATFRDSHEFMQQTGPVYHPSDPKSLKDVIEGSNFKSTFGQQVNAVGIALLNRNLPEPDWIFSHGSFRTCGSNSADLVVKDKWLTLRLAALKTYHQDQELFPAGPPMHIILQAPKPTRVENGWCALL